MHWRRNLLLTALALLFSCLALAQNEDWLPITQQEQQIKDVPGDAGASAIQLYYADYIDDVMHTEFYYHRIKILSEPGNKYADVQIEIPQDGSISQLKARTIHPDGKIIDFTGKPFEKTIVKGRGVKFLAKTFTLPEVTPGSIIEYKYHVDWPYILEENYWTVQHDLYTVKEDFRIKPYSGALDDFPMGYHMSVIFGNMPPGLKPKQESYGFQMHAENIPAFQAEGYMPPADEYKPEVRFFYMGGGATNADKFWQDVGRRWNSRVEHYIGNRDEIKQAAAQAIGNETDPEKKLRALYARVQQIRNLSYERARSQQEQKKENLKDDSNAGDVLSRGYGYRYDITRLFVAMARAAGFEASVLQVSNRKERFFSRGLFSANQLASEIALVSAGGKDYYLDPGTRFCPFGLLRWFYTSTVAMKLDKKGGTFISVPAATQEKAVVQRAASLKLQPDGSLQGEITVQYTGEDALEYRLDALSTDEAGRKKELEDELSSLLPQGAVVKMKTAGDWQASETPLTAVFSVDIPGFASSVGKRLLMPAYLFQTRQLDAFKQTNRKYPVYFPYAFAEVDNLNIQLPSGYTTESVPSTEDASLPYARYRSISQLKGDTFNMQRALLFNGIFFDLDKYKEVKTFFNKVQSADQQELVLKGGGPVAQKAD
ncbi:MAG TPA: DUF3857 domain-containing protein [Candidatus Angelobacter sp.]|nr:DUF3857 domain-containing protein [Candidatus Angelobacter sp.]